MIATLLLLIFANTAPAQGFENIARTPGEFLAGPIAPEQGRAAIVAWHEGRIVSVPEPPGSQPGADVQIRVVDISDLSNIDVTRIYAGAGGFNSHGYFKSGPYLYIGPHCALEDFSACPPQYEPTNIYATAFMIGGPGNQIPGTTMARVDIESSLGLPIGAINRSGAQSPWGAEQWWSYSDVEGTGWVAVRRNLAEYVYDWSNGGTIDGPAIQAFWDHLGDTGVIGFPFIMGNILVYAGDMTGTGVATYDISDPTNPVLLDVLKEENPGGYWPEIYGHYLFFPRRDGEGGAGSSAGYMVVDFSDPTDLQVVADRNVPGSNQYVTFQDEYAFMNRYKIDMRTFDVVLTLDIEGNETQPNTLDASQFALPVGNLLIAGGYGTDGPGLSVWAHQAAPDTRAPFVAYHVPVADQTNYSIYCPITLSIPETLQSETIVDGSSLILRPVGGSPVNTWHSFGQGKLLTVTPHEILQPNTTYELVLTSDILDAAGNGLEPYTFRFSTGSNLAGGNQPPSVDSVTITPAPALPSQQVDISWIGSDPEAGTVEYRVDFGDGSPRTAWSTAISTAHSYTEEGHYQITIQARDDQNSVSADSSTITVVTPPTQGGSTASSMIVMDDLTGRVYVVNPDSDTVSAIDGAAMTKLWEAPVGAHPMSIAQDAANNLWVACRDTDEIVVIDPLNGNEVDQIPLAYGQRPVAIARTPSGTEMLISCEGDGTLRRYSTATGNEVDFTVVGPYPRAIAITQNGNRALVTRFISPQYVGQVYDVDLSGVLSLTRTITLEKDRAADGSASSRGIPNYLAGIRISPDGQHAWVVGKKDNTSRGTFTSASMPLGTDNTVRAQLMLIDLATNSEDTDLRLDIDNSESPTAVAFSPLGDYAFISLQGNNQVAVIDVLEMLRDDTPGTVETRIGVGLAPQGLVLDGANSRMFVADFMDRTITRLNLDGFITSGSANVPTESLEIVEEERFHSSVLLGKQIFYNAFDPRMSAESYISCATCHVDGSHDGRTFDFTDRGEGFRNTTDLRGRSGIGHGAVHWSANFDEIQDFENDIRNAFGGTGFMTDSDFAATSDPLGAHKAGRSEELDALAAYVTSLGWASVPRSSHRANDGGLSEAAQRGQTVFMAQRCNTCHVPTTDYTDGLMHDVGTLRASSGSRLGAMLNGIDTPTLLGVHDSAPYFHNGSAATLEEVFTITGGRLEQAENGITGGGSVAEDVSWFPMKEWHQGLFVTFADGSILTFNDVESATAGDGFVEVRYNAAYGAPNLDVTIGGNTYSQVLPQTPNVPSWLVNEWRSARIPVTFADGTNTVTFTRNGGGGQLRIDDILFSTPEDATNAAVHVRNLSAGDQADLIAYLQSLDGNNAAAPDSRVVRVSEIPQASTDDIQIATGTAEVLLTYTIENNGTGPLNLGQFRVNSGAAGVFEIVQQPDAHVLAGDSTELQVMITTAGLGSLGSAQGAVSGWSDSPANGPLEWNIDATLQDFTAVNHIWMAY